MPCPCGQPSRPRVSPNGPVPTLCSDCLRAHRLARVRRWQVKNADVHNQNRRDWREQNRERVKATRNALRASRRQANAGAAGVSS